MAPVAVSRRVRTIHGIAAILTVAIVGASAFALDIVPGTDGAEGDDGQALIDHTTAKGYCSQSARGAVVHLPGGPDGGVPFDPCSTVVLAGNDVLPPPYYIVTGSIVGTATITATVTLTTTSTRTSVATGTATGTMTMAGTGTITATATGSGTATGHMTNSGTSTRTAVVTLTGTSTTTMVTASIGDATAGPGLFKVGLPSSRVTVSAQGNLDIPGYVRSNSSGQFRQRLELFTDNRSGMIELGGSDESGSNLTTYLPWVVTTPGALATYYQMQLNDYSAGKIIKLGVNATAGELQTAGGVPLYLNYGGNDVVVCLNDSTCKLKAPQLQLFGSTSGTQIIKTPAAAGTLTWTLPGTQASGANKWLYDTGSGVLAEGVPTAADTGALPMPSLTLNYVPKWNTTNFADSQIYDNGTGIGMKTTQLCYQGTNTDTCSNNPVVWSLLPYAGKYMMVDGGSASQSWNFVQNNSAGNPIRYAAMNAYMTSTTAGAETGWFRFYTKPAAGAVGLALTLKDDQSALFAGAVTITGAATVNNTATINTTGTLGSAFQVDVTNGTKHLKLGANASAGELQTTGGVPLYLNYGGNDVKVCENDATCNLKTPNLQLRGSTSGVHTVKTPATAGTLTWTLPGTQASGANKWLYDTGSGVLGEGVPTAADVGALPASGGTANMLPYWVTSSSLGATQIQTNTYGIYPATDDNGYLGLISTLKRWSGIYLAGAIDWRDGAGASTGTCNAGHCSDDVQKNAAITGATKTKITYDAKGLVTAGADATPADVGVTYSPTGVFFSASPDDLTYTATDDSWVTIDDDTRTISSHTSSAQATIVASVPFNVSAAGTGSDGCCARVMIGAAVGASEVCQSAHELYSYISVAPSGWYGFSSLGSHHIYLQIKATGSAICSVAAFGATVTTTVFSN